MSRLVLFSEHALPGRLGSFMGYIQLTTAQAIIKWLENQYIEIDGTEYRVCGGGFGIFGHGNVTCLGEALNTRREELPL